MLDNEISASQPQECVSLDKLYFSIDGLALTISRP
jgi:hypothetical protein